MYIQLQNSSRLLSLLSFKTFDLLHLIFAKCVRVCVPACVCTRYISVFLGKTKFLSHSCDTLLEKCFSNIFCFKLHPIDHLVARRTTFENPTEISRTSSGFKKHKTRNFKSEWQDMGLVVALGFHFTDR